MAHFCIFCETNFRTFTQIRTHKCSLDSPVAVNVFTDRGADKENEILLVNDTEMTTTDMRNHHYTPGMTINGSRNSYEYLMDIYTDTENRNEEEMNNSEVKDLSKSSDDSVEKMDQSFHENGTSEKDSSEGNDLEESVSVDSDYVYTLDGTDTLDSDSVEPSMDKETEESTNQGEEHNGDSMEAIEAEADDTGYVYTMGSEERVQENSQEEKRNSYQGIMCVQRDTTAAELKACSKHEQTPKQTPYVDFEGELKCIKTMSVLQNKDQKPETKEQTVYRTGAIKLVGASKRKRKSSLESSIFHIMRAKSRCLDTVTDKKDSSDESNRYTSVGAINDVVINGHNGIDLSVQTSRVEKKGTEEQQPVDLSKPQHLEAKQSPENLTVSSRQSPENLTVSSRQSPENLTVSARHSPKILTVSARQSPENLTVSARQSPENLTVSARQPPENLTVSSRQSPENLTVTKKAHRRKSSVVARCVNVNSDEQTMVYQPKEEHKDSFQPLDFSVSKTPETKPDIPKALATHKQVKVEAIDLSASSIKKTTNGIKQARKDAPALPHLPHLANQQDFQEMMKKMSNNYMNHNMMTNLMQFQMWMQAAAMNNNVGRTKPAKNGLHNDINKNVVMRDLLTGQSFPDMAKPNMNMLMPGAFPNMASPFTPNIHVKPFAEQNSGRKYIAMKQEVKEEFDDCPSVEGVINWNNQPLTDFKEKDGEPVRFFVKDNEQVQAIVNNLLQTGLMSEAEAIEGEKDMKFICRICDQRFFHVEHLSKHVKKRHVLKKYQCTMCDRSFHDAGNYRQHMRVHDASDVPFECPDCQRRFRHKCTLKVHMRIHTGEKPFKCDVCEASFKISSGLQTHMRKHTGETPYACEFCNLRFKCQSNLKQHLFQHTQERPFACDICGKSYSRKSIRDTHMQTHLKA